MTPALGKVPLSQEPYWVLLPGQHRRPYVSMNAAHTITVARICYKWLVICSFKCNKVGSGLV